MNWIIDKSTKMPYHTDLGMILAPFVNEIDNYNWIVSDFELGDILNLPINYEQDYFTLSPAEFKKIVNREYLQIVWGVILAIPIDIEIKISDDDYPVAESETIFQEGFIQQPKAEIEIICFDSSYTIVKFSNESFIK